MITRALYGGYRPGEWSVEGVPNNPTPGERLVIVCHGHGALGAFTWPTVTMRSVVGEGFTGISADLGVGDLGRYNWGCPNALNGVVELWEYAAHHYEVDTEKVLLVGVSMGALPALNFLRQHDYAVQACLLAIPAVSLQHHHDDPTTLGFAEEIDTAYGGHEAYLAALPDFSPYEYMTAPEDVPLAMWTSTDDTVAPHELAEEYGAAVGAEMYSLGAVGHSLGNGGFADDFAAWLRMNA